MSTYDRELHEKLQKLDRIEAQLAQHRKATRSGLMWLSIVGIVVLVLLLHHIIPL